jgi:hypothetical protein
MQERCAKCIKMLLLPMKGMKAGEQSHQKS